eukprot:SAG11_NODE_1535_length_4727_cov_4.389369_5_plen_75_part_00
MGPHAIGIASVWLLCVRSNFVLVNLVVVLARIFTKLAVSSRWRVAESSSVRYRDRWVTIKVKSRECWTRVMTIN